MPTVDLIDLMTLYSRRGISDWRRAPSELQRRAGACLGFSIAENETEASVTINTIYNNINTNRLRFIPMPKHPKGGIERCFFLPIREMNAGGQVRTAFELFLLVARKDCLAFRYEPAHRAPTTHGYGHVQLSRSMLRRTLEIKTIPSWLPVSYPAFHVGTSDPLGMFLSMATAVHGYAGGIISVLQDIFQKASRPGETSLYVDELKKILD